MMTVLVVAAHPDDEVLGCGATTIKLRKQGIQVHERILGKGRDDIGDQRFDTVPLLEWTQQIEKMLAAVHPDTVFTHAGTDLNEDHAITHKAVLAACRPPSGVKEIYAFEVLSCTEWSRPAFDPDTWVDVTAEIHDKIAVMKERYEQELHNWPHSRSVIGMVHLAGYRGMQVGCDAAEAFQTIRRVL